MRSSSLDAMVKGWFIGGFEPTVYKTETVEVAVKNYKKGDSEKAHYHKIATEVTVVTKGKVKMFDKVWEEGQIIIVEPGDITCFEALEDSITTVVKIPGALNDKYEV